MWVGGSLVCADGAKEALQQEVVLTKVGWSQGLKSFSFCLSSPGQPAGSVQSLRGQLQGGAGDGGEVQPGQQPVPEDLRGECSEETQQITQSTSAAKG